MTFLKILNYLPVCEWCNDQTWRVSQVFIRITKLSIADVDEAVFLLIIPAVAELRNPGECLSTANLDKDSLKHVIKHFRREKSTA